MLNGQQKRYGLTMEDAAWKRLWPQVTISDGCWEWQGSSGRGGYGVIGYRGSYFGTHRFSWMVHFGEIPAGLMVCHKCDNRRCVRPDHLFLGTALDNQRDKVAKGRQSIGDKHGMARYTEAFIQQVKSEYIPRTSGAFVGRKHGERAVGSLHFLSDKYGISVTHLFRLLKGHRSGSVMVRDSL